MKDIIQNCLYSPELIKMSEMNPIKISLIGIGCLITKGVFNDEDWEKLHFTAKKMKSSLSEAVFDPSFYASLNLKGIKCHYDLGNVYSIYGLLNHYQSVIQFQVYNKKRKTIRFADFFSQSTLFPLFQSSIEEVFLENQKNSILIIEKDIGTTCHYKIEEDRFDVNDLIFQIKRISIGEGLSYEVLGSMLYRDSMLARLKGKSLIQYQFAKLNDGK